MEVFNKVSQASLSNAEEVSGENGRSAFEDIGKDNHGDSSEREENRINEGVDVDKIESAKKSFKLYQEVCKGQGPRVQPETEDQHSKMDKSIEESIQIGNCMRRVLGRYEEVRGRDPVEEGVAFWDIVVISAGDLAQEAWYMAQLRLKQEAGDLPRGVPILCVADPPGPRIGSLGSTLHILTQLLDRYGDEIYRKKVLLIHAGGFSKRLPSHSCSGKIFSPIPISPSRGGSYQMLDLKLAMYLPFLDIMEPGVFITASDDIEVYNIDELSCGGGAGETITALAHPSSLYIGTTHGVYVMPQPEHFNAVKEHANGKAEHSNGKTEHANGKAEHANGMAEHSNGLAEHSNDMSQDENRITEDNNGVAEAKSGLVELSPCLEVLQKPSVDKMRDLGAVLKNETEEKVYSDSAFWFHAPTFKRLVQIYKEVKPMSSEMCVYGDLLTCLGLRKEKDYVQQLKNKQKKNEDVSTKQLMVSRLGDTPLSILRLRQSKFYHLGTTEEYLHGLCENANLRLELNLSSVVCSSVKEDDIHGIVLNSVLAPGSSIATSSVVEYSLIEAKVELGDNTILSNVHIRSSIAIPAGFLFHTVAVMVGSSRRYVTVAFHHTDDMKYTAGVAGSQSLQYGGRLLEQLYASSTSFTPEKVFSGAGTASLWTAKLFTSDGDMAESFAKTATMVNNLLHVEDEMSSNGVEDHENLVTYSMDDLVKMKDGDGILEFRKRLLQMCSSCG